MKKIDLTTWSRAEHFKFFLPFSQPFFNIVLDLEVKPLFEYAKSQQISFTASYLYCLHTAVQQYPPIRYRIVDRGPVEVENITLSAVFLRDDESFRFVPLEFQKSLVDYELHYQRQKSFHLKKPLLNSMFTNSADNIDQIYISILPWFKFTSFKHAENAAFDSGIPKIVFGQYQKEQGVLPVSIEVHHALMDGLHISQFVAVFNQVIAELIAEKQRKI